MLEVTFLHDEQDRLAGFTAHGHTDFDEHGQDIVCAAISSILQAARIGLEHYAPAAIEVSQEPGDMRIRCAKAVRSEQPVAAVLKTAELAATEVARRYPEHARVTQARIGKG